MIITVCSFKGGVGKTTTAIHLAARLSSAGRTLLVDADANRSALVWARHHRLPFSVVDEREATRAARDQQPFHTVIDTAARPDPEIVEALARGCDYLVLPTTPDALSIAALLPIADAVQPLAKGRWRVLLTMVPPPPNSDGEAARDQLLANGLPLFQTMIRRTVAFPRAALRGRVIDGLPRRQHRNAGDAYADVANEILNG